MHSKTGLMALPLLLLLILLGGCKSTVKFQYAPPFTTPYKLKESVIISFPDDVRDRRYRVKVGSLWETHVYILPVYDAYKGEAAGRMKGLFTEGVSLTSHSFVDPIIRQAALEKAPEERAYHDDADGEDPNMGSRDLDTILDEMNRQEKGEELESKKSQGELTLEALELSSLEMFEQRDPGYLLYFNDAQLGMREQRVMVTFNVTVIDWRTKNILFSKRYMGRSKVYEPYRNSKTNQIVLYELTKQAFSGTMDQFMKDLILATGAEGPP